MVQHCSDSRSVARAARVFKRETNHDNARATPRLRVILRKLLLLAPVGTMPMLPQGTSPAVAVTQAFSEKLAVLVKTRLVRLAGQQAD